MIEKLTVVLLAGGKSSRFWPLKDKLNIKLLGKTFLEHQLKFLEEAGFAQIVIVVSEELAMAVKNPKHKLIVQKGEGQSGALLSAKEHIANRPILVVNADDLVSKNLFTQVLNSVDEKHNILVGYKTKRYFPGGYLVLEGNRIAKVHEKPGEGNEPSSFVRIVCDYFTNGSTLLNYLEKGFVGGTLLYEEALSKMMSDGEIFEMLEHKDAWIPVKYPWDTLTIMEHYLASIQKSQIAKSASVDKSASIVGPVILGEHVRVMEFAKLVGPLYIGDGAIIGNHTMLRASMIGENSVIGFGSDVTRSYIGDNCWFHSNYIGDSVISDNVGMGAGAVLANLRLDEGDVYSVVKDEKINSGRAKLGAIIGEGARIGIEAQLMPGVKVGKNSVVGPGVILQEDLLDNKRAFVKQQLTVVDNVISNTRSRDRFRKKI